ncbi:HNH endonuclease signature motif containing protein [Kribbella endophytica]
MTYCDERPPWSMTGSEMLSALDAVQTQLTHLQTYRLQLLSALDTNGHAAEIGARDTVQLVAVRHRLDPTEVRRDLRLATALPKYAEVQAALQATSEPPAAAPAAATATASGAAAPDDPAVGDVGEAGEMGAPGEAGEAGEMVLHVGQAEAIITTLERIPATATVPVETLQVAEHELVKAAQTLCPGDLRKLGKHIRNTLDTDGPEPEAQALAAETLWLKRDELGVEFAGYLAGDNAELFHTLIFAGAKPHQTPDGARDPRSRGKRQADALTAILTSAASTGTAAPAHGDIKPHITVTVDLNDLTAGIGAGTLASGATLSTSAVRRLACDAGLIPLVLGSNSEPLDVGTEHRFVTRAIRQTLNARDKGCVICQAPPAMCEAHHLVHWADGGPTTITNLALLCKAHHIDVHHDHWTITMNHGRPQVTRPGWATPAQPP